MAARELKRKRVFRAVLAAGLACNMSLAACGTPVASSMSDSPNAAGAPALRAAVPAPARDAASRTIPLPGLSALAPAQALPVPPVQEAHVWIEAHGPGACQRPAATAAENQPEASFSAASGVSDAENTTPCNEAGVSHAPEPMPVYSFGLQPADLLLSDEPVPENSSMTPSPRAWFSSLRSQEGGAYIDRGWVYRPAAGPSLALGNLTSNAPVWGSAASLHGVQLANWAEPANVTLPAGKLRYSSILGRLNIPDSPAPPGALLYGAPAGSGSLRYGLTPQLTLESQVQSAPSLNTLGWGTTYSAGSAGTFQAGATQRFLEAADAWRYRLSYSVDLNEIKLGYELERISAGFGDLSSYGSGGISNRQIRRAFSAGMPLGHASILSGTYTELREKSALAQQRLGFEQSVKLAHDVRFALGADRDVLTGDYGMRLNLSIPVDALLQGHWLHW